MGSICYFVLVFQITLAFGGIYDKIPKISTNNADLILESGHDKNVTIQLKEKSWFNVNNVNILDLIKSLEELNGNSENNGKSENSVIHAQISNLLLQIYGASGLSTRLNRIENSTGNGFRPLLSIAQRRLITLEERVQQIYRKIEEDNCKSNPCEHGGTCMDLYDDLTCDCPKEWQGKTCNIDVNECALFAGVPDLGCQNGAQCVNKRDGYSCICTAGWFGIHCSQRTVDCVRSTSDLCGHGTCVPTNDALGYTCICEQGWKSNGVMPTCAYDVDECSEFNPRCATTCKNLQGSFTCQPCPAGLTGNGFTCQDIDECATSNGGCSQNPPVPCYNTYGSFHCGDCPLGWEGNGRICTRKAGGICSSNVCHPLAKCTEMPNTVVCTCPPNMTGHGMGLSGCSAVFENPCSTQPCLNGGTCLSNGTSYSCRCQTTYQGQNCQIRINPCLSNPCQNGATCRSNGINYRCICKVRYTGVNCESRDDRCGGSLYGLSGTLQYPPTGAYEHNVRCGWIIRTNVTKVFNITFHEFHMHENCQRDWLQIHDGTTTNSHQIGRFCGNQLPKGGNIITSRNELYLWFKTSNRTTQAGFKLSWESIDPICGGEFNIMEHGKIASPGSPGNYPQNRDCSWVLLAPPGNRIQLTFFSMNLETHISCNYDYLAIYDGRTIDDPLLEKYCKTTLPSPITTPSNEVLIQFHSDGDGSDTGFQIHYDIVSGYPGCGGLFTSSQGEFSSPITPTNNEKFITCIYVIQVPKNNTIELSFDKFHIEYDMMCEGAYLAISDGTLENNFYVNRWCGRNNPGNYKSQTNSLVIKLYGKRFSGDFGFKAKYQLFCGGLFEEEGYITSPLYPQHYNGNRFCVYDIIAPTDKAIVLEFEDFDLEMDACSDIIEIIEGESKSRIEKFCGTLKPNSSKIISPHNNLILKFTSIQEGHGRGFKAKITFIEKGCGGIIKTPNIVIKPPMDKGKAKGLQHCQWTIEAPEGKSVQLIWKSFDLENAMECVYDYVEIYDNFTKGYNGSDDIKVGRFCGKDKPPSLMSISNVITVIFHSDEYDDSEGFELEYLFINTECGANYSTPTGILHSPGWPEMYREHLDCTWLITVASHNQIELRVKKFELYDEYCGFWEEEVNDYLEIRNGLSEFSHRIGLFCGTNIPKVITSLTNHIYIRLHTNAFSRRAQGFEIEWYSRQAGCGGTLNSIKGTITSPNYPEHYAHSTSCIWHIIVNKGSTIDITIDDLEMELYYDYLEIFDGYSKSAHKLGKYSQSSEPLKFHTNTNEAMIRMHSDSSSTGRGFLLHYQFNCNVELTDLHGVIESPNYPFMFLENKFQCLWNIRAPKGNKVHLTISELEFEFATSYIRILNALNQDDLEELRWINKPRSFESTDNELSVIFDSDIGQMGKGFRFEYEIVGCTEIITSESGDLKSPNFPSNYPNDIECKWIIRTEIGNTIEFKLLEMDIASNPPNCSEDGILLGMPYNETFVISKFCGKCNENSTDSNKTVLSHGHELLVRFYSDSKTRGKGFRASYKTIKGKCGGKISSSHGYILSPNYPRNYDANLDCEWLIEVSDNHRINLTFIEFDLEDLSDCTADSFQLFSSTFADPDSLLFKYCYHDLPQNITYISNSNHMFIYFRTDSDTEFKGFKIYYEEVCGQKIIANDTDAIKLSALHNYNGECTWVITASDPVDHITFVINQYQIHLPNKPLPNNGSKCSYGGVSFFGGDKYEVQDAPLLKTVCSTQELPIISSGNSLSISLKLDEVEEFEGTYSVLDNFCGGTLTALNGLIASPSYPDPYPLNIDCEWLLKATDGNSMQLNSISVDIYLSDNCNKAYLEIRENDESGKLLSTLCGKEQPPSITSTQNLWMKFFSDADSGGEGFRAEYQYAQYNDITGSQGVITSPRYPNYADFNEIYKWRLTVEIGSVIEFSLEDLNEDLYTFNKFYDGFDETSKELEYITNKIFYSSTNIVYFTSIKGPFLFKWRALPRDSIPRSVFNSEKCGYNDTILITNPMNISSPGYPYGYEENLNCTWAIITKDRSEHPILTLTDVELEKQYYDDKCSFDYLRISVSEDLIHWTEKAQMCELKDKIDTAFEGKPYLQIQFISDTSLNSTGFLGRISSECGSKLYDSSGIINGTKYVNRVRNCSWEISVKQARKIRMKFTQIDLPRIGQRCLNYVVIKNGFEEDSPILGNKQYCGNTTEEIPVTSSNRALIKFVQFAFSLQSRWILEYEAISDVICGGSVQLTHSITSTIINSPNYPHLPNPHIECLWIITALQGKFISIHFIDKFELTKSNNCEKEYIEIRNGATTRSPVIGKFCGNAPNSIHSKENIIMVKYFTDIPEPKIGFKAEVAVDKCGGIYHEPSGIITSENYPLEGAYSVNSVCEYRIMTRVNSIINITFNDIHLPHEWNCNDTDHLEIYSTEEEDGEETLKRIVDLCNYYDLQDKQIYNNKVLIRFVTRTKGLHYRGFKLTYNSTRIQCGGILNAPEGGITSPTYPKTGGNIRTRCKWQIEVRKGRRINALIGEFDFADVGHRFFQSRLIFYNDFTQLSRIPYNSSNPQSNIVYSTDNYMTIFAFINIHPNSKGLKLIYFSFENTICQGCLSGQECGAIVPPTGNVSNYYCDYSMNLNGFTTAYITIKDLAITENLADYCEHFAPIKIVTWDDEDIAVYCNSMSQTTISFPIEYTKLKILSHHRNKLSSYHITHTRYDCGGTYTNTGADQIIDFPTPLLYRQGNGSLHCAWQIGSLIEDQNSHFSISGNVTFKMDCANEYLNLYNGLLPNSPHLARYCGEEPIPIYTLTGGIYVEYHTTNFNPISTFRLFITSPQTCGGRIIYPFRKIDFRSDLYKNNVECVWTVEANSGYRIATEFIGRFYIEESVNCTKDYIMLTDMYTRNSSRYCGREMPPIFESTDRILRIKFKSDNDIIGDGFTLKFNRICGGVFPISEERRQILYSPNYPHNYDPNLNCNYTFTAKYGQIILLRFLHFEIESSLDCFFDNITIYASSYFSNYAKHYCKPDSIDEIRAEEKLTMLFRTNDRKQFSGFAIQYGLEDCGGTVTHPQMISSPEQKTNNNYVHLMICEWNITAPEQHKIIIKFEQVHFVSSYECHAEYVEIYAGNKSKRLAKFCGNLTGLLDPMEVNETKAVILSQSGSMVSSTGFRAFVYFAPMCDKIIKLEAGNGPFKLNDFDNSYENGIFCRYIFKAPHDYQIRIEFKTFHVAFCSNQTNDAECNCDYLEIRDGVNELAEVIGRFCGHNLPPTLMTTGPGLFLRFVSDSIGTSAGFKAEIHAIEGICGTSEYDLDAHNGRVSIKSPGTERYLPNLRCQWKIFSTSSSNIHLHFEKLDLEQPSVKDKCDTDILTIFSEENSNIIASGYGEDTVYKEGNDYTEAHWLDQSSNFIQHHFCGNQTPSDYYTDLNEFYIKFVTNDKIEKSGFHIVAMAVEGCFKNYTSTQGRLYMQTNSDCEFLINAPENYTITLYYKDMTMYDDCNTQYIDIYDGKSNTRLQHLCGGISPGDSLFTNSNHLKIKTKHASFHNTFDATYLASDSGTGCGGQLYNYHGVFTSPFYPINARNYSNCRWDIKVPQNLKVALVFQVFDMGSKVTCSSDYLEIIELENQRTVENVERRFCGGDKPKAYIGKRSYLSVKFHTSVNYDGTGWVILFNGVHENFKLKDDTRTFRFL